MARKIDVTVQTGPRLCIVTGENMVATRQLARLARKAVATLADSVVVEAAALAGMIARLEAEGFTVRTIG